MLEIFFHLLVMMVQIQVIIRDQLQKVWIGYLIELQKKGYSFILDSNFAETTIAKSNIQRLLDKGYVIEINYIFRNIDKSYEFAKKRESITKRKVPLEIVKNSFKNSFDTTLLIKTIFQDGIILNLFDRENDIIHEDISEDQFFTSLIGEVIWV